VTGPDRETVTNWDHDAGVTRFEVPRADALLYVSASTRPGSPIVVDLTREAPTLIESDRDRATLRAFLTLALQRLDTQEENTR
jgi:hypothetical protein